MFYFLTLFNELQYNYYDVKMFYFLTLFYLKMYPRIETSNINIATINFIL